MSVSTLCWLVCLACFVKHVRGEKQTSMYLEAEDWEAQVVDRWFLNSITDGYKEVIDLPVESRGSNVPTWRRVKRDLSAEKKGMLLPLCPRLSDFQAADVNDLDCNLLLQNISGLLSQQTTLRVVKRDQVKKSESWCACKFMESKRGCKKEFFGWDNKWGYDKEILGSKSTCVEACSQLKSKIMKGGHPIYQSKRIKEPTCWWMKGTEEITEYVTAVPVPVILDKMRRSATSSYIRSGICYIEGPPCTKSNGMGIVIPLENKIESPPTTETTKCLQPKGVPRDWVYCKVPTTGEIHIASKSCGFKAYGKTYVETLNGVYLEMDVPLVCDKGKASGRLPSMIDFPRPDGVINDIYQQFVTCNLHKAVIENSLKLQTPLHSSLFDPFLLEVHSEGDKVAMITNGMKTLLKAECTGVQILHLKHIGGDTWEALGPEGPLGCVMGKLQLMLKGGCLKEKGPPTVPILMKSYLVVSSENRTSYSVVPTAVPTLEFLHGLTNLSQQMGIVDSILNAPPLIDYIPTTTGDSIMSAGNSTGYFSDLKFSLLKFLGLGWIRPVIILIGSLFMLMMAYRFWRLCNHTNPHIRFSTSNRSYRRFR
ncbi:MAG: glycoprotein [Wufeng shrew rhabdovirus 9]|nr:MAG: glycoprotein [Wufeng shrew rhabdovirus 9]